jgi:hypothetical protein
LTACERLLPRGDFTPVAACGKFVSPFFDS